MRHLIFLIFCFNPLTVVSKTTITYGGGNDNGGPIYLKTLLELALEKTKPEFGDFELVRNNKNENYPRLIIQLDKGVYENLVMKVSITDEIIKKYNVIKFPLDRGVTGYRIAFTSLKNNQKQCEIIKLKDVQNELTIQGIGWLDTDILKRNHFNVHAVARTQQMLKMIERNRAEYFFRGINEIRWELSQNPNVSLEPCFALQYSLPRFFITKKRDIKIAKRIELGLKRAFEDGSFIKLWRKYYIASIQMVNMKERQIFELENPYIATLDDEYRQYNYKFSELNDY